ncbi:MAG: hypothetical protein JSU66_11380, partial [Deltaproteobacteria bacterium]
MSDPPPLQNLAIRSGVTPVRIVDSVHYDGIRAVVKRVFTPLEKSFQIEQISPYLFENTSQISGIRDALHRASGSDTVRAARARRRTPVRAGGFGLQGGPVSPARRFAIRTFGCQMNVHDSEKVSNLLLHDGYERARALEDADVVIVNTCSIREKAEHRLYSDLGSLRSWKQAARGRVIGVGG